MDKVAFLIDGRYVYWRAIILALAVLAAVLMALALVLRQKQSLTALCIALPFAIVFSLFFARLIHWYCRFEGYESLKAALTRTQGGYSLIGVFAGTLLAFGLVRLLRLTKDLPSLLDCVAPGAALGIAVGRLGDLFSGADRGKLLIVDEAYHRLPFASPVTNSVSGAVEWRFASFFGQSLWAFVIFLVLMVVVLWPKKGSPEGGTRRGGQVFSLFMTLYCLGQILFDSTRYDALFLRSNGFVSLVQILCCVVLVLILVLRSVRSLRAGSLTRWHPVAWIAALGALGGAGYMEYYVQRHGNEFLRAYGIMALCLAVHFFASRAVGLLKGKRKAQGGAHLKKKLPENEPPQV